MILQVYGRKLTDEEIRETIEFDSMSAECMSPTGPGIELELFPWLRHVPILNKNFKEMQHLKQVVNAWYESR